MLRHEKGQAVRSAVASEFGDKESNGAHVDGLNVKNSRASAPCAMGRWRAILSVLVRKNEGRGRSLLVCSRRIVATSRFARGVSFGGNRIHGLNAPAFIMGALHPQILTGGRGDGFRAYRFLEHGTSYSPRPALPVGKGVQLLQVVLGASVMMRTLSRNVSTAFPSIPEPVFCPAESIHNRAYSVPKANTFTDVADCAEGLLQRAHAAYREACNLPSASARRDFRARLSDYVSDLIAFCREVEALPATATKGACNG